MATDYDLFVIGAGSGGVRAARIAASHGAKVAIAEEYRVGGTCVIRGCVPKKLLVYASRYADEFTDAKGFGWSCSDPVFDWPALIAAKDREIARLEGLYKATLERFGVTLIERRAHLTDAHAIELSDGSRVSAKTILIATGGHPNLDEKLPGIEHAITSNEAFHMPGLPRRIIVAGGGYIAAEFASIFNGLGAETTLLYRGDKILRGFDEDLRDGVMAAMEKRGLRIITSSVFSNIEKAADGLNGTLTDGTVISADQIMFAIGRSPNSTGLGLENAGVALAPNGAVIVDAQSRTTAENIYAVGDVTDRVNLTPVAIREGHAFADSVFGAKPWATDYNTIPTAVFSTPEIGTVGLNEADARARHAAIDIYKTSFRPMRATLAGRDERMLMKLVVDAATDRVLGLHVVGDDAAEIVQMAAVALKMGARKSDFDATIALHPSASEELVLMREKWTG